MQRHPLPSNIPLLGTVSSQVPLQVANPFVIAKECALKEKAVDAGGQDAWVWRTDSPMPPLPAMTRSRHPRVERTSTLCKL